MLSKNEAKYIQSLSRKKQRQEEKLFVAEGVKLVGELIGAQYPLRKIYATAEWIALHPQAGATEISQEELERLSALPSPNQVIAIAEQRAETGEPVLTGKLTLALDGIQDPGNFGTIIRIADWFGIGEIICSEDTVELYNPKVIQATMGSFIRVKVWYRPLVDVISTANNIPVYGALLEGTSIYEVAAPGEAILLIGNEGKGINRELLPHISVPITIPRFGHAESLNAAVATGIIVSAMKSGWK
jgi:TrmH family RNA methyltransferase